MDVSPRRYTMASEKRTPDRSIAAGIAELISDPAIEGLLAANPTVETFCTELAKSFKVRTTEVALLRLERGFLKFIFPPELRTVGTIPLSSSAVAARTAVSKKLELFNSFNKVKHAGFFEKVRLGKGDEEPDSTPIQKLMSAPILDPDGNILGVVEISRKGSDTSCGPDFTLEDLQQLELAAHVLARAKFMQEDVS